MSRFGLLLSLASLLLLSTPLFTTAQPRVNGYISQYLVNGDFETGLLAPWQASGQDASNVAVVTADQGYPIHGGRYALAIGAPNDYDLSIGATITQTVPHLQEFGETLQLSFYLSAPNPQPTLQRVTYSFNGGTTMTVPFPNITYQTPYLNYSLATVTLYGVPGSLTNINQDGTITLGFYASGPVPFLLDDIVLSGPTVGVVGDPQFVGLRGQHYQVHGIDGQVYSLISAPQLTANARFVFLNSGKCPILAGVAQSNCWSHPGSYLGAIGIQQVVDGTLHQIEVQSGSAKEGFALVSFDGVKVSVGGSANAGSQLTVSFDSTHRVTIHTPLFNFAFDNSDYFINQQLTALVTMSKLGELGVHGLLGQTHQRKVYKTQVKYIEGEVDDYVVEEGTLFGTDTVFSRFEK